MSPVNHNLTQRGDVGGYLTMSSNQFHSKVRHVPTPSHLESPRQLGEQETTKRREVLGLKSTRA